MPYVGEGDEGVNPFESLSGSTHGQIRHPEYDHEHQGRTRECSEQQVVGYAALGRHERHDDQCEETEKDQQPKFLQRHSRQLSLRCAPDCQRTESQESVVHQMVSALGSPHDLAPDGRDGKRCQSQ